MNNVNNPVIEEKVIKVKRSQGKDSVAYSKFCKPKLTEMLNSLKLDTAYHKAKENYLYYKDDEGHEIPVLDFVSGFGSNFLGHNNDALKDLYKECLDSNIPMNAQSSVRIEAHKLAEKLNILLPAKSNYFCHLTNSGAETVEAALKHAYKNHLEFIRRKYESITRQLYDLYHYIEDNQIDVVLPDGVKELSKYRDDLDEYNLTQYEKYQNNPVACAFKGSYHGKTSSALKVTFNKTFREGFEGMSAIKIVFIDLDKPKRLEEIIHENQVEFLLPVLEKNELKLKRIPVTQVFAMILEIILGEGGVKSVPRETLQYLADIRKEISVPYIIDEIQTGCGRIGKVFGYENTPLVQIEPDYILLSKALGGGMVKIGACMINENCYDPDFGFLHTSTFAEDDISCIIAQKTLDLITENNRFLLDQAVEKGNYLRAKLSELQNKYPDIVKEVRGEGLMIGLEFQDLSNYSPLFRYAGRQGFISLMVASFLLHYYKIRVLAPLTTLFKGNPGKKRESILRVQPSVYITKKQIEDLVNGLDECFNVIHSNNEYYFLSHLFENELSLSDIKNSTKIPVSHPEHSAETDFDARIGFIVHITELKHLIDYYLPSFNNYEFNEKKLIRWWNKLSRFLEPDVMHKTYIEQDGFVIELNLVCVPYFPKHMIKTFTNTKIPIGKTWYNKKLLTEMQDKIMDAAIVARDLGDERIPTSLVGLGAYNSIVTENGNTINDFEISVTTGNAYTTALMGQGIIKATEIVGNDISSSKVSIIGAAGNIGSTLCALMTFYTKKIFLVGSGKENSHKRMELVINNCLSTIAIEVKSALTSKQNINEIELSGIAGEIFEKYLKPALQNGTTNENSLLGKIINEFELDSLDSNIGEWLKEFILAMNNGTNPYYIISDESVMKESDIVAIATNSSDTWLIGPEKVKKGAIVCCASVPSNLSENFKGCLEDYFVFDGGYAKLPNDNAIKFVGMPKDGMAYGCLSESLLLGFDGQNHSFSKGELKISQVMQTIEMAEMYDFDLGEFRLGDAVHKGYN